MTYRAQMMAALTGESCESIPRAPRMDLWYIAQRERGTLPPDLVKATISDIAKKYGFACHAVRGDYTRTQAPEANKLRGIGFENHPDFPCRFELRDLPIEYSLEGEETITRIETSSGPVVFHLKFSGSMRTGGISLPFKLRYAVEEPDDLARVAELFEHLEIVPAKEAFSEFRSEIGEEGVAVAHASIAASPIHLLLHELMPMDLFFFWYHDRYRELKEFEERVTPFFDSLIDVVCDSGADVALWGANFDRDLTWPPFFDRDIAPWLMKVKNRFHTAGILLLCHTDGENSKMFDSYAKVGFDVAESVCARPMTELSLLEQRKGLGDEVAIWGGIPSVLLLADSVSDEAFISYLESLERDLRLLAPNASRLILGVSDNVPPDAKIDRLNRISEWVSNIRM